MSWALWLEADVGGEDERPQLSETDINYTSNAHRMIRLAMGGTPCNFKGLTAEEALPYVEQGVVGLEVDEEACRELQPPNGWGDYDSFLAWMRNLRDLFARYPKAIIGTWC